ncbi:MULTISPECIES: hypothetical protein [unclassified Gilliamella]|uniref:hypothetical protein n=1 Tax=unclassified Gilliamella TaxID=2685620 RepID=UPI00080EE703|nr:MULTISPECIES: hypothetical protein [Gilliamella]MCX8641296.1 hypothetical protein [Gilliamella sp. B3835]MCX8707407.1 hypothetical protein [Gilliamella sp. B3783]MCX8709457.1 hypothetical protein [Gilliamella sp. B3780]MCX8712862.1 hypothetical protein [Gilliamella sp. B3468]MCX8713426.1 hypothetical protein [Gilliamella sp. B3781]
MTEQKNELYQEIEAWAQNAILHSPTWSINQLDYSEKSITVVEMIISEIAEKNFSIPEEQLNMIAQEYGCYLLLTAHKIYGGEFYYNEEFEQPMLICCEPDAMIVLMTWNKVKGRLLGDKTDHIAYFLDEFGKATFQPEKGTHVVYL